MTQRNTTQHHLRDGQPHPEMVPKHKTLKGLVPGELERTGRAATRQVHQTLPVRASTDTHTHTLSLSLSSREQQHGWNERIKRRSTGRSLNTNPEYRIFQASLHHQRPRVLAARGWGAWQLAPDCGLPPLAHPLYVWQTTW